MKAKIELRVGEQREKVISDGVGFYSKGRLCYFELDQKTKQEVWFDQDKIEIVRKGEVETRLRFHRFGLSSCEVNSQYGCMQVPVRLLKYEIYPLGIYLSYQMNEKDLYHFYWNIEPLG